jgi:hypothetical protein
MTILSCMMCKSMVKRYVGHLTRSVSLAEGYLALTIGIWLKATGFQGVIGCALF